MAPPKTKSKHDAGKRRVYAELQENQANNDVEGLGHGEEAWTTVAAIWCDVMPLAGRELLLARQVSADVSHRIEWGYDPAYTPRSDWRVKVGDRIFYFIEPPRDYENKHEIYQVQARHPEPLKEI